MTQTTRDEAVLPCPFCGSPGKIIACMGAWAPGGYEPDGRRVACSSIECITAGKPFYGEGMEANAISWWNRRASAPSPASGGVDAVSDWRDREIDKLLALCESHDLIDREAFWRRVKRLSPAATPVSEAEPVAWRWRNADGPWHVSLVNPHEGRYDKLEHRPLYEALAKPASSPAGEQEALRALYEWYDRDGSVGGASEVFEEHRAALSQSTSAGRVGE